MSGYHFKPKSQILFFLPKSLQTVRNIINPPVQIQSYSSSSLWLYGEIECLIKNEKYSSLPSIYSGLRKDPLEFYIDVINLLPKELEGIEYLVEIEHDKYNDYNAFKIDFNRLVFFHNGKYLAIHKDMVFNKFLNIYKFQNELFKFLYINDKTILMECQNYVVSFYELKNFLLLNYKYYNLLQQNEETLHNKKLIKQALVNVESLINSFKEEYDYAFYFKNMLIYCATVNNLLDKIQKPHFDEYKKAKICKFKFPDFKKSIIDSYSKEKEIIEKKIKLFSEETILKNINSNNELCFSIMNK